MALTDPLQPVVILLVFVLFVMGMIYFYRTMKKAEKGPTSQMRLNSQQPRP